MGIPKFAEIVKRLKIERSVWSKSGPNKSGDKFTSILVDMSALGHCCMIGDDTTPMRKCTSMLGGIARQCVAVLALCLDHKYTAEDYRLLKKLRVARANDLGDVPAGPNGTSTYLSQYYMLTHMDEIVSFLNTQYPHLVIVYPVVDEVRHCYHYQIGNTGRIYANVRSDRTHRFEPSKYPELSKPEVTDEQITYASIMDASLDAYREAKLANTAASNDPKLAEQSARARKILDFRSKQEDPVDPLDEELMMEGVQLANREAKGRGSGNKKKRRQKYASFACEAENNIVELSVFLRKHDLLPAGSTLAWWGNDTDFIVIMLCMGEWFQQEYDATLVFLQKVTSKTFLYGSDFFDSAVKRLNPKVKDVVLARKQIAMLLLAFHCDFIDSIPKHGPASFGDNLIDYIGEMHLFEDMMTDREGSLMWLDHCLAVFRKRAKDTPPLLREMRPDWTHEQELQRLLQAAKCLQYYGGPELCDTHVIDTESPMDPMLPNEPLDFFMPDGRTARTKIAIAITRYAQDLITRADQTRRGTVNRPKKQHAAAQEEQEEQEEENAGMMVSLGGGGGKGKGKKKKSGGSSGLLAQLGISAVEMMNGMPDPLLENAMPAEEQRLRDAQRMADEASRIAGIKKAARDRRRPPPKRKANANAKSKKKKPKMADMDVAIKNTPSSKARAKRAAGEARAQAAELERMSAAEASKMHREMHGSGGFGKHKQYTLSTVSPGECTPADSKENQDLLGEAYIKRSRAKRKAHEAQRDDLEKKRGKMVEHRHEVSSYSYRCNRKHCKPVFPGVSKQCSRGHATPVATVGNDRYWCKEIGCNDYFGPIPKHCYRCNMGRTVLAKLTNCVHCMTNFHTKCTITLEGQATKACPACKRPISGGLLPTGSKLSLRAIPPPFGV